MKRVRRLGRAGKLLLALGVAGAVFGIATAVQASIPDANGVIHGCYNTSLAHGNPTGALRVIDTSKPGGVCTSSEAPLDWNANGVKGATGARGPTGPAGISLFANVDGTDGSMVSGTATGSSRPSEGRYVVTFDRDVSDCAGTADPGFNGNSSGVSNGGARIDRVDMGYNIKTLAPDDVTVRVIDDATGNTIDNSVHLIVVC